MHVFLRIGALKGFSSEILLLVREKYNPVGGRRCTETTANVHTVNRQVMKKGLKMLNKEYFSVISKHYWSYVHEVKQDNMVHLQDSSIFAEDFFRDFLNSLYGWSLRNANEKKPGISGYDLIDTDRKIIVQVSSKYDKKTIQEKLTKAGKHGLEDYRYYYMAITLENENASTAKRHNYTIPKGLLFDALSNILVSKDILVKAQHLGPDRQYELLKVTRKYSDKKKSLKTIATMSILALLAISLAVALSILSREKPVPSITTRGKQENLEIVYTDLSIKEYNRGLEYYNQGKYAESERCFEDALSNAEPLSLDAAEVHISLGLSRYMLAQSSNGEKQAQLLSDALDDMVSASAIFQENGKESEVIYGLLMQGFVNKALGEIDGTSQKVAVDQYKEAYGKAKDLYGEENYYTCDICNCIASLYISDKNVDDAELWLEKALKISIREDEMVTASVIKTLNSIAYNCQELGKFRNEIGILLVTAEERYVGIDDVDEELIRLYNNIGSYYHNIVKNDKMARHYDDLYLRATSMVSGKYNYDTAVSYHNLANDFRDSNYESRDEFARNQEEALRLYKKSLEILEKIDPKTITDSHINIDGLNMDIEEMGWLLEDINRAISWYEYNEATFGYQKLSIWNVDENGNIRLLTDDEYHAIVSGEAIVGEEVELP